MINYDPESLKRLRESLEKYPEEIAQQLEAYHILQVAAMKAAVSLEILSQELKDEDENTDLS